MRSECEEGARDGAREEMGGVGGVDVAVSGGGVYEELGDDVSTRDWFRLMRKPRYQYGICHIIASVYTDLHGIHLIFSSLEKIRH
ncbi:hypothetical protein RB195_021172 [Necator americanus]